MSVDHLLRKKIYAKTDGYCHICHRKLSHNNYGKRGTKGAWHIEHSIPRAKGGTNHLNNLFPACIDCNIEKSALTSRTARSYHGNSRAPYSRKTKNEIKENNTTAGVFIGGAIGLLGGPWGMVIGATIGGMVANDSSPRI